MKSKFNKWQLCGFLFTVGVGTLLHFLYEWSGKMSLVGLFSNVNESTWEHMKLLFFPAAIFAVIQSFFFKDRQDFWSIKLKGIILGLVLIPVIYYLFNGIIGKTPDWMNIAIFVVSVAATFIYESKEFDEKDGEFLSQKTSIICLSLIAILFFIFTFYPPELGIFIDQTNNSKGI